MSSALNRSSALQRFERGKVVKIRNGIMFDFYPELPHVNSGWTFRYCATTLSGFQQSISTVLLISPHFESVWRGRISVRMFVQVQACTCASTLSGNAPQLMIHLTLINCTSTTSTAHCCNRSYNVVGVSFVS